MIWPALRHRRLKATSRDLPGPPSGLAVPRPSELREPMPDTREPMRGWCERTSGAHGARARAASASNG
jgi:hypothetical protein